MLGWWEEAFIGDLQALQLALFPFWSISQGLESKLLEMWFVANVWINAVFLSMICLLHSEEETFWDFKNLQLIKKSVAQTCW